MPLILRFYFTIVLDHYFAYFLFFPWPINYNHSSRNIKSFTHSSPSWFWSKIFSLPWIHSITHGYVLQTLSYTNERKTALGIVPRFNTNLAPSRWRSQTTRGAPSFQNQTPLSLVLWNFSKLSYLGDFVVGWSHF
jgi:hypothetical protein